MPDKITTFRGSYYFLSNFYTAPVTYNGITFTNNEAAFQAQKCVSPEYTKRFATMSPSDAKRQGRLKSVRLRPDWESVKTQIMHDLVLAKFTQNEDLKTKLLATGTAHLEEGNTWGDRIWGTVNGIGENRLGKILMQVRDELRVS